MELKISAMHFNMKIAYVPDIPQYEIIQLESNNELKLGTTASDRLRSLNVKQK